MKRVWQALPFAYYMLTLAPHRTPSPPLTHILLLTRLPLKVDYTQLPALMRRALSVIASLFAALVVFYHCSHTMLWRGGRGVGAGVGVFGSFKLIDLNQFLTLTYYAQFLGHSCGQIIFITHTLRWTAAEKGSTRQV